MPHTPNSTDVGDACDLLLTPGRSSETRRFGETSASLSCFWRVAGAYRVLDPVCPFVWATDQVVSCMVSSSFAVSRTWGEVGTCPTHCGVPSQNHVVVIVVVVFLVFDT